jgi:hypothetical protein
VKCGSTKNLTRVFIGYSLRKENIFHLCEKHKEELLEYFKGKKLCNCEDLVDEGSAAKVFYQEWDGENWVKKPYPTDNYSQK